MARIIYRGIEYDVTGYISTSPFADKAGDGIIVTRTDRKPMRSAKMHPGMMQTGVSPTLRRAARQALISEQSAGPSDADDDAHL